MIEILLENDIIKNGFSSIRTNLHVLKSLLDSLNEKDY